MSGIRVVVLDAAALGFPKHDVGLFLASNHSLLSKYWSVTNLLAASWPAIEFPQYFQAMHGDMSGFFEIRLQSGKTNARFFAKVVSNDSEFLLVITAATKRRREGFSPMVYATARLAYSEFLAHPNQSLLLRDLF
jgi:hypothetical protein